jgi:RNA polymerase-binding transcription factor DksA
MDEADRAQAAVEFLLHLALRQRNTDSPKATGVCLWCGEELPDGRRWCSPECRDAWEVDP